MRRVTFIFLSALFMALSGQLLANTALHFDSNDEYGDVQHAAHYDIGTSDFTVNCIVKFDDYSEIHQNSILFKGIPNSNYIQLEYTYPEMQRLKFAGRGLPDNEWIAQITDWIPTLDVWYSIAGVRTGDTFTIYLIECADVSQVLSAVDIVSGVGNPTTTTPWVIGDGVGYHREFLGDIDDVRFWDRALSLQELQAYATTEVNPSDSGLLGYWQCNEGSGNVLLDSSPYQRHGELIGPVTYVNADWYTGGPVGDLVFDDFESGFQSPPWTELDPHVVIEPDGHNGSTQCLALYNNEPWSSGFITAPIVPQDGLVMECWVQRRPNQNNRNYFWFSLTDGPPPDQGQQGMRFRYGAYQHETICVFWNNTLLTEVPIDFDYDWTLLKLVRYDNGSWDVYWDNELIISSVSDNFGTLADPHINILGDGFYNEGGVRIDDIQVMEGSGYPFYEVDDDTEALWRFNEDPGTYTAYDATTNNHTMALTAGAEFTGTNVFNGSVDCTGPTAVATNFDQIGNSWDALSIDVHFMATVIGDDNTHPLVTRYRWHNTADPSYLFWVMPDGSLFGKVYMNEPGGVSVWGETGPGVIETGQWYDVQMTWSSDNTLKIYVDGELLGESTMTETGVVRPGDDPLEVGAVYYTGYPPEFFTGYIDEVRISDIDRSTQEPPDGPVTLTLTPSNTTIPPGGGTLTYDVHIVSTLPDQFNNVYYWTNLILPDGSEYPQGGWLMSQHVILRPFMDVTRTEFTQNIPVFADPGDYEFQAHFGYMGGMYASDSFAFTKLSGTSNGNEVIDWNATGNLGLDNPDLNDPLPDEWAVAAATPNPFNPTTTIRIALPEAAELTVTVTNILGQRVAVLTNGLQEAGEHSLVFDARGLASGLYFIHAHVPGQLNQVQKVMLVR